MIDRHLFKRVVENKNGKKEVRWYYWFYDDNGKQVKKSCGQHGKPCLLKREAEAYLAQLAEKDKQEEAARKEAQKVRLRDIGATMFVDNSIYLQLKAARGVRFLPQTLKQKRLIMQIILNEFGDRIPDTIEEAEVENFLITLNYSNSYRNLILGVIKELFRECKRLKIVKHSLEIDSFSKSDSRKKDIFSMQELSIMFPNSIEKLTEVWETQRVYRYIGVDGKTHSYGLVYGVLFRLMASTGLRPGECRAICIDQIRENGLLVNKMLDAKEELQHYLKKGNESNLRQRTVLIPDKMAEVLELYLQQRPKSDTDFIFTSRGHLITGRDVTRYFKVILKKLGIYDGKRILSPHSLRFTYNTYTVNSNLLPESVLRKMIGHKSEGMTDYYTRPDLDSQLAGLLPYQQTVNEIWDNLN